MKKYFLTLLIFLISCSSVLASTQGRLFLEVSSINDRLSTSLEKVNEKNIEKENLRDAFLHIQTNENILLTDLDTKEEHRLEKHEGVFNVSSILREKLEQGKNTFDFKIDSEYCIENCGIDKYPFIEILYIFNKAPNIHIVSPEDGKSIKESEITLKWEGVDSDGKFLEYMVEIEKEGETFQSEWSTKTNFQIDKLEDGVYTWRVFVRDNSFLNNVVSSKKFTFTIDTYVRPLLKPTILSPKDNWITKDQIINFSAKTDTDVENKIFVNDSLVRTTQDSDIDLKFDLKNEGENIFKIVSSRDGESKEASVRIVTKWSPPKEPDFELKLEGENVLIRIVNNDYKKAYIFFQNKIIQELEKTDKWIDLGNQIVGEIKIGVVLEDEVGNKTKKRYRTLEIDEELLGTGAVGQGRIHPVIPNPSVCIYKYNKTHKKFDGRWCNMTRPQILDVEQTTKDRRTYKTKISGVYNPHMLVLIDEFECTLPIICRERFVERKRVNLQKYSGVNLFLNEKFKSIDELQKTNKYFFTAYIVENKNMLGSRLNIRYRTNHGFRYDGQWANLNLDSPFSNTRAIPPVRNLPNTSSKRIFRFPFTRNIGVTQWHGYTAFQSPHTGVDFGSYREPVYAIGDGTIRAAQWDNYSGSCLSGGYFVRIEHDNGMNSVYLHLENYRKRNGRNWRVGERIRRGELIGITGNTGAYNCQPLGYHLHFELRRNHSQRNHTNPVPYINVNWDNIPTLGHNIYPGRLTGDNPHPTW